MPCKTAACENQFCLRLRSTCFLDPMTLILDTDSKRFLYAHERRGSKTRHDLLLCIYTKRDRWVEGITLHFIIVPTGNSNP